MIDDTIPAMGCGKGWVRQLLGMVLVLCAATYSLGQSIRFNTLNTENGLSQNSVLTIVQDKTGYIWIGTRHGLNKYDGKSFKTYLSDPSKKGTISSNYIISSLRDSKDNLWIGTTHGLNRYLPDQDSFISYMADDSSSTGLKGHVVNCIYEDRKGSIWVGTNRGLNKLTKEGTFTYFGFPGGSHTTGGDDARVIFEDHKGDLWIGTTSGLIRAKLNGGTITAQKRYHAVVNDVSGLSDDFICSIVEDDARNLWIATKAGGLNLFSFKDERFSRITKGFGTDGLIHNNIRQLMIVKGELWIGTLEGLSIMNLSDRNFRSYQHDYDNRYSLSNNSIYALYRDKTGSVWIGSYHNGLSLVYAQNTLFYDLDKKFPAIGVGHFICSSITEDGSGRLWIGSEGAGLKIVDQEKRRITGFMNQQAGSESVSSNLVKGITHGKDGTTWIATHLGGLNKYSPGGNGFIKFTNDPLNPRSLASNDLTVVLEDSQNRLWVGTERNGLDLMDRFNHTFRHFTTSATGLAGNNVMSIFEDSKKRIWIGTNNGLNLIPYRSTDIQRVEPKSGNGVFPGMINCIAEDSKGVLWIGAENGGITRYEPSTQRFRTFSKKDGLGNDNVMGMLMDDQDNVWLSTSNGISRFDKKTLTFSNYSVADGLSANIFSRNAVLKSRSGKFYFGGLQGVVTFAPAEIQKNTSESVMVITDFRILNKSVEPKDSTGILDRSIGVTHELTLTHGQNIFSIDYALLNYVKPEKNRYAYQMEGLESDWNYVSATSVTYNNLPPGDYTFRVKGANNDQVWSHHTATLLIHVKPPYWSTWWAYGFYFLVFTGAIVLVMRYFYLSVLYERERELQQSKLNFFTNISHEIRTHLTLIQGPVDWLVPLVKDSGAVKSNLLLVKRNTERLLRLVTELMDFRKVESSELVLKVTEQDLIPFLRSIFADFKFLSDKKNITSVFDSNAEEILMYFDAIQIEKVIFNLLTNAYKFSDDGGRVELSVRQLDTTVEISIVDHGKGIEGKYLSKIFTNFFQVYEQNHQNTGYGIGLALSKSIVDLHHGQLRVESKIADLHSPGETCFTVTLSKGWTHFGGTGLLKRSVLSNDQPTGFDENGKIQGAFKNVSIDRTNTVLVVEDNDEIRQFLLNALSPYFQTLDAENGERGWDVAVDAIPDLIISDVMMAEMDGMTLCANLKSDPRTSHIPVVLLTAMSAPAHQLSGLRKGADAYIVKPFDTQILLQTLSNLLKTREVYRQKFSKRVGLPLDLDADSPDEAFLSKIADITKEHMAHPDFGVPLVAEKIAMSQSVLYKKVKALTNLPVNDFLKSIRLEYAAQLLQQGTLPIADIAYSVGYQDRKYFSKEFKKQFGKNPSEFAREPFAESDNRAFGNGSDITEV